MRVNDMASNVCQALPDSAAAVYPLGVSLPAEPPVS